MEAEANAVLVVDDERDLVDTVCANLEVEGYAALTAHNGADAIRVIGERESVRLVLLDIRMPGMNGVEALAHIRKIRPELPVILMTAYALRDLEDQALEIGAYTVIQKPFDMNVVLQLIARAIRTPALLVIDPRDGLRQRVNEILEGTGHQLVAVTTGDEALAALRLGAFDVAILSISSVRLVIATLAELRAADASLSIIVVTRDPPPELLAAAPRLGISGWLAEPVTRVNFLRLVAEVRGRGTP
jgi:two-component system, NtrC family, response regulator HydG